MLSPASPNSSPFSHLSSPSSSSSPATSSTASQLTPATLTDDCSALLSSFTDSIFLMFLIANGFAVCALKSVFSCFLIFEPISQCTLAIFPLISCIQKFVHGKWCGRFFL
jgi:hypothetical protein